MSDWEKNKVMYFIRSAEHIGSMEVPKIISLLHESDARIVQISYMDQIPAWGESKNPDTPTFRLCDGTQIEFTGEPKGDFDLTAYVAHISEEAVVSGGRSYEGTQMHSVMVPNMLGKPESKLPIMKRFQRDVMWASAQMQLGNMSGKEGRFDAGTDGKGLGLADLLGEADAHGMKSTAFYHVFAGIPCQMVKGTSKGTILTGSGTEIIASSPLLQGNVKFDLKKRYNVDVYVGGKLVA